MTEPKPRKAGFLLLSMLASPILAQESASWWERFGLRPHGFADVRAGVRTRNDPTQKDTSLAEARFQLDLAADRTWVSLQLKLDAYYDDVVRESDIDLEQGRGYLDLREANALFSPTQAMDLKIGRQILTWGTGDLVFINDLFPKDYQSFFAGRDEVYLKAPSDAVFVSVFPRIGNIDIVYTPRFDADRYLRGERLSYFNPGLGRLAGRDAVLMPDQPDSWFDDGEIALRFSKNIRGLELAFYGYDGFWKSPAGQAAERPVPIFPRLRVMGASARGSLGKGLFHLETGYYDSREDRDGRDPRIANGELRLLAGYERELARNFTLGFQAYLERLLDYDAYRETLPEGNLPRDEDRVLTTLRLTRLLLDQNLTLSLFSFYSPTDEDYYLRPQARYKVNDPWLVFCGANLFGGRYEHSFFGQFQNNGNVYAGARFSF